MYNILITGIAGLIGANFSRYLLDKGYNVIGIDNLFGGYKDNIDDRIISKMQFHEIDLINNDILDKIFDHYKPDFVYHFAAYAAEGLSPFIRNFNYTNNVICSVNVINNCIKYNVKKIIFTSSMAVYGHGELPFEEDQYPNPSDPYGIAKYTVEMDLRQAYDQFGLNYSIVRPHNVIGIYQNIWDKYRNVIGIWIRQAINNEKLTIFGDGNQIRAFSDIDYCHESFEKLMFNYNTEIFNIGSDVYHTINEVANIVKNISNNKGFSTELLYLEKRNEVKDAYSDHKKAKNLLNFKDNTDIEYIINKMFDWALKQPNRKIKDMKYEIDKNIYSFWKK